VCIGPVHGRVDLHNQVLLGLSVNSDYSVLLSLSVHSVFLGLSVHCVRSNLLDLGVIIDSVLTSQVVGMVSVNEVNEDVDVTMNNVDEEGLAVLAMLDMIKKGDLGNEPRLDKTHQGEGEGGREIKKVKLNKVKTTDQTGCDGDTIRAV
jgi:hypothetical protein